ncbi:hypothetical protein ACLKA6_015072 [Drosophila palustris]
MHPRLDRFRHYQQQPQQQQQQQQQQQSPQRVLFVTRRPEPRPEQEPIIVVIDDATLKAFVRCVYIIAAIFILVTSITWLAFSWTEFRFLCGSSRAVLCVDPAGIPFADDHELRACLVGLMPVLIVLAALVGSIATVAIFYACGALCPQKLLPGVLCTACLSCILVITLFILIVLIIFIRNAVIGLVFAISLFCLVVLMMPFHAQYIHGRLEIVPMFEMLHSSLTIYIHFVLIFVAIDYLYHYHELKY